MGSFEGTELPSPRASAFSGCAPWRKSSHGVAGAGVAQRNPESKGAIMDERGPPCAAGSGAANHDSESE